MSTPSSSASAFCAERLDLVAVGQVGRKQLHAVAELAGQRLELLDAGAVQADDRALRMQHAGDRLADAAGCAGDERLAAGQIEHFRLLDQSTPFTRVGSIA